MNVEKDAHTILSQSNGYLVYYPSSFCLSVSQTQRDTFSWCPLCSLLVLQFDLLFKQNKTYESRYW